MSEPIQRGANGRFVKAQTRDQAEIVDLRSAPLHSFACETYPYPVETLTEDESGGTVMGALAVIALLIVLGVALYFVVR